MTTRKAFYRIGEVSALLGVEPHVLRYWEREFRTIRPVKSPSGQRVYSEENVAKLTRVRELLYTDRYTIVGAKKQLRTEGALEAEAAAEKAPSKPVRAVRRELLALRTLLTQALEGLPEAASESAATGSDKR